MPLVSNVSQTLPQPVYPGFNNTFSSDPEGLDPNFRATAIDSFDLTVQRQLNRRLNLEVGYIGRRITHEYQPVELNPVPYMMTLGGQQFKQAYANLVLQYCGGVQGLAGGGCAGASTTGPTAVTRHATLLSRRRLQVQATALDSRTALRLWSSMRAINTARGAPQVKLVHL